MEQAVVNITYKLTGEAAEQFLLLKRAECMENSAELARSLQMKQLHEELRKRNLVADPPAPRAKKVEKTT